MIHLENLDIVPTNRTTLYIISN